jgi:hypothetical protein
MRSTAQGGGNIVATNLVLYLDAMNPLSYGGSGTTWKDLTGYKNDFILYNSPTFTGNGIGFNGTTQYAQCVNTTGGNFGNSSFTLEYVLNITSGTQPASTIIAKRSNTYFQYLLPGYYYRFGNGSANSGVFNVYDDATPNQFWNSYGAPYNQTLYITHRVVWTGTTVAKSVYENGIFKSTATSTNPGTNNSDNATAMRLMQGNGYAQGTLHIIRAYNKALTPDEITQNYNATKDRFGI